MFTGIVETRGRIKSVELIGSSGKILVEPDAGDFALGDVKKGDSISVSGVCLTVTDLTATAFTSDVSGETLKLSTLGRLVTGAAVNLEKAITLSKPLGGHLVTGHVDGLGTVKRKDVVGENVVFEISVPDDIMAEIVKKGSVAVDGVSLTVAELTPSGFTAAIVPHTMKVTTLHDMKPGDVANIETDIIGKYVMKYLAGRKAGLTEEFLAEHGFSDKK